MSNGNGVLKHITKCRLKRPDGEPCGHQVLDHPLNVQIVGQPDARMHTFMGALMRHVEKRHPDAWSQIQGIWHFFLGFLVMGQYETADPAIIETIQQFGAQLRRIVQLAPVTDAEFEGVLAHVGFTQEDPKRAEMLTALKNLQAYHQGNLQKPPAPQAEKPLIVP